MITPKTSVKTKSAFVGTENSTWRRIVKYKNIYILLIPATLYYILFSYAPMFGNVIAFQKFSVTKGVWNSPFVGLENFRLFVSNYKFWQLIRNTLTINALGLLFVFPAPIILALLLNEVKALRFKKAVQSITYMPYFISTVVVSSLILTFAAKNGFVNEIRHILGFERISFMTYPQYFYPIYTISGIWQEAGWGSIIYIAVLSSIDSQLYEAAVIDGAGRWRQLLHITLPGILPTAMILLIMRVGQMLNVEFEKILLIYNPSIYETADVISTFVYRRGIAGGDYSYSAAVGFFNSTINLNLLVLANFFIKKTSGNGLW